MTFTPHLLSTKTRLDTLFLTMPISWKGTLQQYVGRLDRIHQDKKVVRVYDYVAVHIPMLARMYEKRLSGYRAIGYVRAVEDTGDVEDFVAAGGLLFQQGPTGLKTSAASASNARLEEKDTDLRAADMRVHAALSSIPGNLSDDIRGERESLG